MYKLSMSIGKIKGGRFFGDTVYVDVNEGSYQKGLGKGAHRDELAGE